MPPMLAGSRRALAVAWQLLAVAALALFAGSPANAKSIAFTFDDVPRQPGGFLTPDQRTIALIAALKRARIEQAAFFVIPGNLEKPFGPGGEDRITAYAAAGHVIGNHSYSHPWLSRTSVDDYVAGIDKAQQWLAGRPGYRPWYRFPYLDEGGRDTAKRDALRVALAERGLMSAYVTIDNYDWHLDNLARIARENGRDIDMDALRDLYVETLVQTAEFYDAIAVATLGRSPAHVILLHETDLAALFIEDLAAAFRAAGWEIVTADEAFADPIARELPDTWFLGSGRVAALAHAKGMEPRQLVYERTDEDVLTALFEERVMHAQGKKP